MAFTVLLVCDRAPRAGTCTLGDRQARAAPCEGCRWRRQPPSGDSSPAALGTQAQSRWGARTYLENLQRWTGPGLALGGHCVSFHPHPVVHVPPAFLVWNLLKLTCPVSPSAPLPAVPEE